MHIPHSRKSQHGYATVEYLLGIALLLVPLTILVLSFSSWYQSSSMTRIASREAARTYAVKKDAALAQAAAIEIAKNYGQNIDAMTVELEGDPNVPGSDVTALVQLKLKSIRIAALDLDGPQLTLTSRHSEPIDVYISVAK